MQTSPTFFTGVPVRIQLPPPLQDLFESVGIQKLFGLVAGLLLTGGLLSGILDAAAGA